MRSTSSTRRAAVLVVVAAALAVAHGKAPEPLPIRVVFQLQDPIDGLCLSPRGFAPCDTTTLWTVGVTSGRQSIVSFLNPGLNPAPEAQCLERVPNGKWDSFVRLGSCKASNSLKWNIKPQMGGAMPCDFGYTALNVVEASLHERGFLLTTRDGTCFDGVRFRM
ncbi:hypothetical protein T492DRAFT_835508 [Pavlovales sp. CCMP2436]|nr:hypothetical protein T492DRAFT_835508 [Pavlovales sp. CCMP2436]